MSFRSLRAAVAAVALFVATASVLSAQGPVYRERWGYLHLEHRRAEVLAALRGRSELPGGNTRVCHRTPPCSLC